MFLFLLRWIFFTFNSASPQLLCAMSARNLRSHLLVLLCFQHLYFSTTCATCATCTTCATCAMLPLWVICLQPTICATCATFPLLVICLQPTCLLHVLLVLHFNFGCSACNFSTTALLLVLYFFCCSFAHPALPATSVLHFCTTIPFQHKQTPDLHGSQALL